MEDKVPRLWWVKWMVWVIETSGPTFTKLGQWASSRSDLFPQYVCTELSELQSNNRAHSFIHTRNTIEDNFNEKLEDVFSEFERKPIGVGAIGQVYKAKLRESDQYVAVKVLHPYVRYLVNVDLDIMKFFATVIEYTIPNSHWLSLPEEVDMFSSMMRAQLDLSVEAQHLVLFGENFDKWDSVGFPQPIQKYVRKDILVEKWVDGILMEKFLKWGGSCYDKQVATIGLTSFLKMLILDNHLHADLHPGNIIISFQSKFDPELFLDDTHIDRIAKSKNKEEWKQALLEIHQDYNPYLYYIDAGLVSQLSVQHFSNFIDLFKAITDFDGNLISKLMVERSRTPNTVIDFKGFSEAMKQFMIRIKENAFALKHIQVTEILTFVFDIVRKHHVKIEGDFANVGVAIILLEGVGKQLEPDLDLLKASVPFLSKAIKNRVQGDVSKTELGVWNYLKITFLSSIFK
ncbi:hypothetical protein HK103_002173 [Boothiomyces macroporosus]|uniref:Protein kinase domain-containing protein n=1 Tax=Boothiomyces macroporosus TaxID=261099 RepID=A0AAD5U9T8_9FUNG|nr:hypothetical protein HK103_002173 [Boothiomyces macroporosus]